MTGPVVRRLGTALTQSGRGVGVLEALREGLPAWAGAAFAAVTHLGDTWLLLVLGWLVYLAHDRRAGGFVLGALFVGFALTLGLKAWFGWPRPPGGLRYVAESGAGFPSGHAMGSTVGWGALAVVLDRVSTVRRRGAAAGIVVAAVAVSRVAIGVHYLVDVVAGVGLGLGVLAVAGRVGRDRPRALFGLAGGLAIGALLAAGAGVEAVVLLGACAGAAATWPAVDTAGHQGNRRDVAATAVAGGLATGGLVALAPTTGLAFGGAAAATAIALLGPVGWERWYRVGPESD
ncbi:MAG: phosphatase PAP2 family protein [Halobacteriales archaeon]